MHLTWFDIAQPVVAGLGGILGSYLMEDVLAAVRRGGLSWLGWRR
ncbi:MAG TPA: hypothetical protein VF755_18345 [Catenuloplanes sp.]|jgi:hypothetical protein